MQASQPLIPEHGQTLPNGVQLPEEAQPTAGDMPSQKDDKHSTPASNTDARLDTTKGESPGGSDENNKSADDKNDALDKETPVSSDGGGNSGGYSLEANEKNMREQDKGEVEKPVETDTRDAPDDKNGAEEDKPNDKSVEGNKDDNKSAVGEQSLKDESGKESPRTGQE